MERVVPAIAAAICVAAAVFWIRQTIGNRRVATRLSTEQIDPDLWRLADADYRRDLLSAIGAVTASAILGVIVVVGVSRLIALASPVLALPSIITLTRRRESRRHRPGGGRPVRGRETGP